MIVNFSVRNFGPIKDEQTLSFEASKSNDLENYYVIEPIKGLRILKLALVYGPNASGKSTILKALNFLKEIITEPLEKKSDYFNFTPFLFDSNSTLDNSSFGLEFIQSGIKYYYEIEFNTSAIVDEKLYYYSPNKALVFHRTTELLTQFTSIDFGSKIKIKKELVTVLTANTLWNNTVLGGFLKTNIESKELQDVVSWFKETLKNTINPKTNLLGYISNRLEKGTINKNNLLKFLSKADLKISDIIIKNEEQNVDEQFIEFLKKRLPLSTEEENRIKERGKIDTSELIFQHKVLNGSQIETYELPYTSESDGTQRYYQFSGLLDLMIQYGAIFPIDEIESSLHPDLLKHFLLTFLTNTNNSQIIATTHHRELLIEKDLFRTDAIWFTEKQDNGSTDLFSLEDFDSSTIRSTSSVYNAYKIGKLGAVPNLGDYYNESNES